MNASRLRTILPVAILCAGGGFLGGYYSRRSPEVQTGGEKVSISPQPVKPAPPPPGPSLPARLAAILGDQPLTDANANSLTYRVLEESNPVSRMAATGLILESMTASNAGAIYQAFRDITTSTGRRHDAEWGLMLKRYGEVSGAEGLKAVKPHPGNMAFIIEGMASVDPAAATAAMAASGIESPAFTNAWLAGLCRKDPDKAIAAALSGEYDNVNTDALLRQAIHTSGLNGAREAIQKVLDANADEVVSNPVFLHLFNSLADTIFHRHTSDGNHGDVLSWLEQQKGQPYLSAALIDRGARETFSSGKAKEAVAWIERMNEGSTGATVGGQGLFEGIALNPKVLVGMDAATFDRIIPRLPQNPTNLEILAKLVATVSPERASQIRAALPPAEPPPAEPPPAEPPPAATTAPPP